MFCDLFFVLVMEEEMRANMLVIRELDMNKDTRKVEELERRCEAGSCGEMSLFTDLLGDPICRIRNSPSFIMLVRPSSYEI